MSKVYEEIEEESYSDNSEDEIEYYSIPRKSTQRTTIRKIIEERQTDGQNIKIPHYKDKKYICLFRGIKFDNNFFFRFTS